MVTMIIKEMVPIDAKKQAASKKNPGSLVRGQMTGKNDIFQIGASENKRRPSEKIITNV